MHNISCACVRYERNKIITMCVHVYVRILSGSATITSNMATVTVRNLQCQQTYTITAGGILNGMLVGPQFRQETVTAGSCSTTPTPTSSPSVGKS